MKIILAGTPEFSVPTFEKIISHFNVVAMISQPDRKQGRKFLALPTSTKMLARKYNIPIFQPEKIDGIFEVLKSLNFDIFLTMSYGQIIPERILKLSKICSLNIHGSLLPKYRGAAPVQHAILNGEKEIGISLIYMEKKMDSGDILFQEKIKFQENDNATTILEKMSKLSSEKIIEWLNKIKNNEFKPMKQNEKLVTFANKIRPEDEKIDYDTMEQTLRKINALSLTPGAYFDDQRRLKRIKVYKAIKTPVKNAIEIKCVDGVLYAVHYQIEGRNKVEIK